MKATAMVRKKGIKALLMLMLITCGFNVLAKDLQEFFEEPQKVGEARLTLLFWDIYDAALFAPKGSFVKEQPFALKLKYLRSFKGEEIASRSVDEIRNLGMKDEMKLAKWYQAMQEIFPNVEAGETITGIVDRQQVSHFYFNENLLGKIHDKEFSQWFFNIWLSEKTSEPEMREQLLGNHSLGL